MLTSMEIGDEYIYRVRDFAPSQRVRILDIQRKKTTSRVDIEFLDGDQQGTCENVPGARLKGLWAQVETYDWWWANWARLNEDDFNPSDDIMLLAVAQVFSLLIPDEVAEIEGQPFRDHIEVRDPAVLEATLGTSIEEVTGAVSWFEADGTVYLSPAAGELVAELACRQNPKPILELVIQEEAEQRELCKRGRTYQAYDGSGERFSPPEQEYSSYRRRVRPRHELLRQWCGYRAVNFHERLTAAEAEVERLDILVARLIDIIKQHDEFSAKILAEENEQDRITPESVRPVVDRPLDPSEVRVVHVKRRRRWP